MSSEGAGSGLRAVLVATVVAGAIGYVIQGAAGGVLSPADFLPFSVFWSLLYLTIAGLSGLQQEVTRATRPADTPGAASGTPAGQALLRFALVVAGIVAFVALLTSPFWAPATFKSDLVAQVAAYVLGIVGYTCVAVVSGLFYGVRLWVAVAAMTIVDAVIRLLTVGTALALAPTPGVLALAVAVPFPIALVLVAFWARPRLRPATLDVALPRLARHVLATVGGAIATGVLTSGFPLLIGLTSSEEESVIGALVFVITLTRAPLVVPAIALQSFLTVHFRDRAGSTTRAVVTIVGLTLAVAGIVALIAWPLEPLVLTAIWGEAYSVSGLTCALVVLTAGMTAVLCVTGAAVLAQGRHAVFLAGWAAAAAATVALLFLPLPLEPRVLISMGVGPLLGFVLHLLGLRGAQTRGA